MKNLHVFSLAFATVLAPNAWALAPQCVPVQSCLASSSCTDLGTVHGITVEANAASRLTTVTGEALLVSRYRDTWKCPVVANGSLTWEEIQGERAGAIENFKKAIYNVEGIYRRPDDAPLEARKRALDAAQLECVRKKAFVEKTQTVCSTN